jgi:hypothetical protein
LLSAPPVKCPELPPGTCERARFLFGRLLTGEILPIIGGYSGG